MDAVIYKYTSNKMPNWTDNHLTISHTDKKKVDDLGEVLRQNNGSIFHYLRPNPDGENAENWYDWNNENWGTKWDIDEYDYDTDGDHEITLQFQTEWSPPEALYRYLHEQGWKFNATYVCESYSCGGRFTNWNEWGNENGLFFEETYEINLDNEDELDGFDEDFINNHDLEFQHEQAQEHKKENEEEEEDENMPINEASKIILKETPGRIGDTPETPNFYIKEWLVSKWETYAQENSDKYDETWFALITTPGIKKTINWKYIVDELNK